MAECERMFFMMVTIIDELIGLVNTFFELLSLDRDEPA